MHNLTIRCQLQEADLPPFLRLEGTLCFVDTSVNHQSVVPQLACQIGNMNELIVVIKSESGSSGALDFSC